MTDPAGRETMAECRPYRVGVDVGGTFTDLVAVDESGGDVHLVKRPTTPHDQSEGVAEGLVALLGGANVPAAAVGYLGHGTTVCINAMLERKGAVTGLITTTGMRDLLELRRQTRPRLYDLQADKPEPVIPRQLRREVSERTLFDGSVRQPIDLDDARRVLESLVADGIAALAICFLHSYVNPAHEHAVRDLAQRLYPSIYVSASSDVLAEFREFERLSTTALNAYVGPVMGRYLERLERRVTELGFEVRPFIVQSNGGVATISQVRQRPVFTMASGPSAGVAGATFVAESASHDQIITFDMGGTSTDVCVVVKGAPVTASQKEYEGYPVKGAMLDVDSVGAGGGSLAWIDPGGFLRVGPQSAGAVPGPACYGSGGTAPTVTDANLVLGRLSGDSPLGGTRLNASAATAAIETLCPRLGLPLADAALGVLTVVNTNMASAIRLATVERGLDPRLFTLVAYGGAGPMHATRVASSLGIPKVLVPMNPGVLCALGLLVADVRAEFSRTAIRRTDAVSVGDLDTIFQTLEDQAREWFRRGGLAVGKLSLARSIDMRYLRQNYELTVAAGGKVVTHELDRRFHRAHHRLFGHDSPSDPTELVTFRVAARIPVPRPRLPRAESASPVSIKTMRPVRFHGTPDFVDCPVYERGKLSAGAALMGPAIVEQVDCTTVIEPGQATVVDAWGNLVISVGGGA